MPHILIDARDLEKNMEILNVHVHVQFSDAYYKTEKAEIKLMELNQKLEQLVDEYFPDKNYTSDILSNHEWNVQMGIKNY